MSRRVGQLPARQSILLGMTLTAAGSWLLWQGYEGHGRRRPWAVRLLPGA